MSRPSLFSLPYEVRAMIILATIQAPHMDPPCPGDLANQQRQPVNAEEWDHDRRCVLFPPKPPNNPALPLLLASRQLHAETVDALRRGLPASKAVCYTADVVYLRDNGLLFPTWLSVPVRAAHADTIHVQFRIVKSVAGLLPKGKGLTYSLHHLLTTMLASGGHGPCGGPITVGRLVLDFLPAGEAEAGDMLPVSKVVRWEWVGEPKVKCERVLHSDIRMIVSDGFPLADELRGICLNRPSMEVAARWMGCVLRLLTWIAKMDWYQTFKYAKVIYEQVGVVEFRLDGQPYKTLDLTTCLAEAQIEGSPAQNPSYMAWYNETWKREIEVKRRELGLQEGHEQS